MGWLLGIADDRTENVNHFTELRRGHIVDFGMQAEGLLGKGMAAQARFDLFQFLPQRPILAGCRSGDRALQDISFCAAVFAAKASGDVISPGGILLFCGDPRALAVPVPSRATHGQDYG